MEPTYMQFYEVLPADAEAEASTEVEEESTDDGVDLEDMDDSFEDSEDEAESGESEDSDDDTEEESDTEGESEEADEEKSEDDATEEVQSDEEKQKQHNREMAAKRLQDKQQREDAIREKQQEYISQADGEDPIAVAVRQLQVSEYNNKVDGNTNKLTNGYERAIKDFPILNDPSPEVRAELAGALDAFQAMHVTMDTFSNPTDVRGDLYQFLQAKADSIAALTGKGARQQLQSKGKEKSKTLITPTRAPKAPKKDPDLEGFDEEAARY